MFFRDLVFNLIAHRNQKLYYDSWKSRFLAKSNRGKGFEIIEN
jgi:hypothetical protein